MVSLIQHRYRQRRQLRMLPSVSLDRTGLSISDNHEYFSLCLYTWKYLIHYEILYG
jgi:hypothetical protein